MTGRPGITAPEYATPEHCRPAVQFDIIHHQILDLQRRVKALEAQPMGRDCKVGNVSRLWAVRYRGTATTDLQTYQVYRDQDTAAADARWVAAKPRVTYVDIEEEIWTITEATPDGYSVSIDRSVEQVYPVEDKEWLT